MSNLPALSNPIYPKKRSNTFFQVGDHVRLKDNVILATLHGEVPQRTIGIIREVVYDGVGIRNIYKVQFEDHPTEEQVFEYELEKVVYEENPVYNKTRPPKPSPPKFGVGQNVAMIQYPGMSGHIDKTNYSMGWHYLVSVKGRSTPVWFTEHELSVYAENPVYPKRRFPRLYPYGGPRLAHPPKFHVGDEIEVAFEGDDTLFGYVYEEVSRPEEGTYYYKVGSDDSTTLWVPEKDISKYQHRHEGNPIYPKKRKNDLVVAARVRIIARGGKGFGRIGTISHVSNLSLDRPYEVTYPPLYSGGISQIGFFNRDQIVPVWDENPIYPKRRYVPFGSNIKVGDQITVLRGQNAGLSGTVHKIYNKWEGIWMTIGLGPAGTGWVDINALDVILTSRRHESNPIYPKRRRRFYVGQKVTVRNPIHIRDSHHGRWGKAGIVAEIKWYHGIDPNLLRKHGEASRNPVMVLVNFLGQGTDWFFPEDIEPVDVMRLDENPIYPKHRFINKFKIGDRVITTNLAGGRNKTGVVYNIHTPDNISDEHSYDIHLPGGAWSQYYESSLMLAPEENPIYRKRRSIFSVGQTVATRWGKWTGTVIEVKQYDGIEPALFREHGEASRDPIMVRVDIPNVGKEWIWEGDLKLILETNPIYPKRRGDPEYINIGDQVTVTDGHAAGSSGEVISTSMPPMPGYITIRTVSGKVYAVKRTHVIRTHPRYRNNQPRRWGVWPAEDPPVGEVVIDSHPTSERHGTTATVVQRSKSTTGEGIYLLKFRDGFERWYTSLQIRRMPSKLGWKSMQENVRKIEHDDFQAGDRVQIIYPNDPNYLMTGTVVRPAKEVGKYFLKVKLDNGVVGAAHGASLRHVGFDENPIFPKKRAGLKKFKVGDIVHFTDPATRWNGIGTIVRVHTLRKDMNRYDIEISPESWTRALRSLMLYGIEEQFIEFSYDENPIYDKKRQVRDSKFSKGEKVRFKRGPSVTVEGVITGAFRGATAWYYSIKDGAGTYPFVYEDQIVERVSP